MTTYLVHCDHVEVADSAGSPDPGPECSPGVPPSPRLVRVEGLQEWVDAFPGEVVTHTYTVYNLGLQEAITASLEASSEHGWTTQVSATVLLAPGQGKEVAVRLSVPGEAPSILDWGTLRAIYPPRPDMQDEDGTTTRVTPVKIVRFEVRPGTALQVNEDGWYEPNPVSYWVYFRSIRDLQVEAAAIFRQTRLPAAMIPRRISVKVRPVRRSPINE